MSRVRDMLEGARRERASIAYWLEYLGHTDLAEAVRSRSAGADRVERNVPQFTGQRGITYNLPPELDNDQST